MNQFSFSDLSISRNARNMQSIPACDQVHCKMLALLQDFKLEFGFSHVPRLDRCLPLPDCKRDFAEIAHRRRWPKFGVQMELHFIRQAAGGCHSVRCAVEPKAIS